MWRSIVLAWLVACERAEPPPPPPPSPGPRPLPKPLAPCTAADHVVPSSREDVAWTKHVTDRMRDGLTRKQLVCMFGTPDKPNGSFIQITPRARAFQVATALATANDHPEESIEVRFAPGFEPQLASIERALGGTSEASHKNHWDQPEGRILSLPAPDGMSIRALMDLVDDAPLTDTPIGQRRVAQLQLDVSDVRGWTPPVLRCWDGAHIWVRPGNDRDRFEPGAWAFEVTDRQTKQHAGRYECSVPADILDIGRCTPPGERPPGVVLGPMASDITLHLPVGPRQLDLVVTKNGVLFVRKQMDLEYTTMSANTPSSTCTTASPSWLYLDP